MPPRARRRTVRLRRGVWVALAVALGLVSFLYYRPVQAYMNAREALDRRTTEVRQLRKEHSRLERQLRLTDSGATLVRDARRLGLVRPDERLFIVKGIEAWRRAQAAARRDDR
jgi:cell division protein FtsB